VIANEATQNLLCASLGKTRFYLPTYRQPKLVHVYGHVTKIGPKASPEGHAFRSSFAYSQDHARSICSPTGMRNEAGRGQVRRLGEKS